MYFLRFVVPFSWQRHQSVSVPSGMRKPCRSSRRQPGDYSELGSPDFTYGVVVEDQIGERSTHINTLKTNSQFKPPLLIANSLLRI